MANLFDAPPAMAGDEKEQLQGLYRYLMQMSEQLNEAMNGMSIATFTPEAQAQIREVASSGAKKDIDSTRNALRSLIIKTADIVRTEMDEISAELKTKVEAQSTKFGTLVETLEQKISANATGIAQNFSYYQELDGRTDGFEGTVKRINSRIFSGIIAYDQVTGDPITGIAIGEGVTAYDAEWNPIINTNARMATFTKNRLSFWQGDTEVAYFSDRRLHITSAEVSREMRFGFYVWEVQTDQSLGLMVSIPQT